MFHFSPHTKRQTFTLQAGIKNNIHSWHNCESYANNDLIFRHTNVVLLPRHIARFSKFSQLKVETCHGWRRLSVWRWAENCALAPLNFCVPLGGDEALMHKLIVICMQLEVILIFIIQHLQRRVESPQVMAEIIFFRRLSDSLCLLSRLFKSRWHGSSRSLPHD